MLAKLAVEKSSIPRAGKGVIAMQNIKVQGVRANYSKANAIGAKRRHSSF